MAYSYHHETCLFRPVLALLSRGTMIGFFLPFPLSQGFLTLVQWTVRSYKFFLGAVLHTVGYLATSQVSTYWMPRVLLFPHMTVPKSPDIATYPWGQNHPFEEKLISEDFYISF